MTTPALESAALALANAERVGAVAEARHFRMAREVLRALRMPCPEMVSRGDSIVGDDLNWDYDSTKVWQAMVDAALG